jgi:predicted nucleic acid-binding Zn ribbon protein
MTEYLYKCVKCRKTIPITKPMVEASKTEHCPFCGMPMPRVYTPAMLQGETVVKIQEVKHECFE